MEDEILKHQIRIALEPIRAMLIYKVNVLDKKKWLEFVKKTCASIASKPEQYLPAHLLENKVLAVALVYKLFKELNREWKRNGTNNGLEVYSDKLANNISEEIL
jgi:hypothetical protein